MFEVSPYDHYLSVAAPNRQSSVPWGSRLGLLQGTSPPPPTACKQGGMRACCCHACCLDALPAATLARCCKIGSACRGLGAAKKPLQLLLAAVVVCSTATAAAAAVLVTLPTRAVSDGPWGSQGPHGDTGNSFRWVGMCQSWRGGGVRLSRWRFEHPTTRCSHDQPYCVVLPLLLLLPHST